MTNIIAKYHFHMIVSYDIPKHKCSESTSLNLLSRLVVIIWAITIVIVG